jgi:N4-gp56 family major capsid protein
MARTVVGVGDPKAIRKQSALLSVLVTKESFHGRGMMTRGADSKGFVQRIDDLKSEKGDRVDVDLLMPARMDPIIGSDVLDGNEEDMVFFTDNVRVDQVRGGMNVGDTMTRKRTIYDLRKKALRLHKDWWKRVWDEVLFIYASGTIGKGIGYVWRPTNKFFNVNNLQAPDAKHQFYAGSATSGATIAGTDKVSLALFEKMVAQAETMGGDSTGELSMLPGEIGGEEAFCAILHPYCAVDLRRSTATGEWLDIQKAAVTHEGSDNPIFKGGSSMGVYNGVIIKKHRNIVQFAAGANGAVNAARNLFYGRQGLFLVSGNAGDDMAFSVTEEVKDHKDKVAIGSSCIFGVKKASYAVDVGQRDFGIYAFDAACTAPA